MKKAQRKIVFLVKEYKKIFPAEYAEVVQVVKRKRIEFSFNAVDKTGSQKLKKLDFLDRALLEYPETLWVIFNAHLKGEELAYLTTKEGARWFGKKYKEFRLVEKI